MGARLACGWVLLGAVLIAACRGGIGPTVEPAAATAPPTAVPAAPSTPTPTGDVPVLPSQTAAPTATLAPAATLVIVGQWAQTRQGLTVDVLFDPFPPVLGSEVTYQVILADSAGRRVPEATVALKFTGGMAGMEGEHDEEFSLALDHLGDGVFRAQAAVGSQDLVLTGISITVRRGVESWTFNIAADELRPR